MCVLKSGGIYSAGHVALLREQIPENIGMLCLTDMPLKIPNVDTEPLLHDLPGWWSKIELFRPGIVCEDTVYLDLDTVVCGDVETLFRKDFTVYKDVILNDKMNSSVMAWYSPPIEVYLKFMINPSETMQVYRRWPKMGDQAFINDTAEYTFYEDGLIRSYRKECLDGVPDGTVIVAYHGKPKPWDI